MSFYMNMGILNEGEQADAYKKRKADEKAAQDKKKRKEIREDMIQIWKIE